MRTPLTSLAWVGSALASSKCRGLKCIPFVNLGERVSLLIAMAIDWQLPLVDSLCSAQVGFYQMAKLLMSPFVAAVEMLLLKKRFPVPALACILVVLAGVGIVTVK